MLIEFQDVLPFFEDSSFTNFDAAVWRIRILSNKLEVNLDYNTGTQNISRSSEHISVHLFRDSDPVPAVHKNNIQAKFLLVIENQDP